MHKLQVRVINGSKSKSSVDPETMDRWMDERVKRGRPNNAENGYTRDLQSLHGGASLQRSARHVADRPRRHEARSGAISN